MTSCYGAVTRLDFHPVEDFTRSDWKQEQIGGGQSCETNTTEAQRLEEHHEFFAPGISSFFSELSASGDV
jgi:hypothetical protein